MLVKLLAAVLAAVSISVAGVYLASDPDSPTPFAAVMSGSDDAAAPSCCATPSRLSCCMSAETCDVASAETSPESLAACVGGFAIAHQTADSHQEISVTTAE